MKEGFSKLDKNEKIDWVINNFFNSSESDSELLKKYWNDDNSIQTIHDEFAENTITNFYLPLGVAPNFIIDKINYTIPMAIEESSVVAAACKSAKFWSKRGGFKSTIINKLRLVRFTLNLMEVQKKLMTFLIQLKINLKIHVKK